MIPSVDDSLGGITFRPLTGEDQPFLFQMLLQAIYTPLGEDPPGKEILSLPEISKYAEHWGKPGDQGIVALDYQGNPAGAIWLRYFDLAHRGYGFISHDIPEISMALLPKYRGLGVGTALLRKLFSETEGITLSLSVDSRNPAVRLYERMGFREVKKSGFSLTMIRENGEEK